MKNSIGILVLSAILFLSYITVAQTQLSVGDAAPPIKVAKWFKGNAVNNFEKGKVYVVEFWATWCLPCIAGMSHLSELAAKYKNEVTVSGISVWERKTTTLPQVENFVDSMGSKMAYHVAIDDNSNMGNNWLKASGSGGIPAAFIIDKDSKIVWIGLPKMLDKILPKVIDGSWNVEKNAAEYKEKLRLTKLDDKDILNRLNPYMGNPGKSDSALIVIDQILAKEPGLKYYPKLGHFMLYALIKTNQEKALAFAKAWLSANEEPSYRDVTDAVGYMSEIKKIELIKGLYELSADCYYAQLDNYPWSMDFPVTYDSIAMLEFKAGNNEEAVAAEIKAIEAAKKNEKFPADQLAKFKANLKKFMENK